MSHVSKVRLTLEYDGTDYVGWQWQPNGPSIQGAIEAALERLLKKPVRVSASGRTDAGVHALGQTATFVPPFELPLRAYVAGLTSILPRDIAVIDACHVPDDFDARRSALGKRYRYRVLNRPQRSPLRRRHRWEVFQPLDVDAMARAVQPLLGRHDFSAFRASNCEAKSPVKLLTRADIRREDDEVTLEFVGDGFLKQMVRNLTGLMVACGRRKFDPSNIPALLESCDRRRAPFTAPPQGLTMTKIWYEGEPMPEGWLNEG